MRLECFEFKRCCCCIPLRHGLLALGYLKLAASLLVIVLFFARVGLPPSSIGRLKYLVVLALLALCILVMLGDVALTIVFLAGGHKKCPKLLRVYNNYSIVVLALYVSAYILFHGMQVYYLINYIELIDVYLVLRSSLTTGFVNIGFQMYIILMTKSEIAKLEEKRGFAFSNIAQEAECKMVDGEGNIIENEINISELENEIGHENVTRVYIENNEPEYQIYNENYKNDQTED